MEIREIKEKNIWENFLLECQEKTFLDSWNWGEFQKKTGSASGGKVWRLGVYENNNLIAVASIIKVQAKRGTFLFLPHGPNTEPENKEKKSKILKSLLEELKNRAKEEGASFIRISPIWERNEENNKIFKEFGFKTAPIHMHPELTWELDITPSEEELLANMRKTTRYLIRQAEKNELPRPSAGRRRGGVSPTASGQVLSAAPSSRRNKDIEIIRSQNIKDLDFFNKIYQETVKRHHFAPFSLNYLENQFSVFNQDDQISLFLGKYQGEIVSSAIVVFWQKMAFYHHGASILKYSKIPVSYLLQWEAIKEAKKRGCQGYNFWGIADSDSKNPRRNPFGILRGRHPWAGLSLFKMGFGGYRKEYVKTQDLPLSGRYWLTFIFEKLRKTKRGL